MEKSYINILWSQLLPQSFYVFVSKKENIQILNKINAKFQDAVEIVKLYTEMDSLEENNYKVLENYLRKYIKMYQFVFSNLFPRYYSKFNSRGVENSIEFNSFYANYLNEVNISNWQKNDFLETLPILIKDESESENENNEGKTFNKIEIEKKSEEKKQKRLKRKLEMEKRKKILEEKLKENTEKMYKIKKM